ncbi:MAG: TerB family tellurite resistance protein [Planctomycetes bacterium]|nr:TerB family tellurite resistance protein [Planctomycetota bacterium]
MGREVTRRKGTIAMDLEPRTLTWAALVVAVDGSIGEQERQFLERLARHMGVGAAELGAAIATALDRGPAVGLPTDPEQRLALLEVMILAATADGVLVEEERRLLEAVARRIDVPARLLALSTQELLDEVRGRRRKDRLHPSGDV